MKYTCKDCLDRHEGCHSKCEKYAEYRKEWEAIKAKMAREKKEINLTLERKLEAKWRKEKRKRR